MASREQALEWAQQVADRSGQTQAIRQDRNGEWSFGSARYYAKASTQRMLASEGVLQTVELVQPQPLQAAGQAGGCKAGDAGGLPAETAESGRPRGP